ncbi:MAG: ABC transporter permease [Planctomycetes bacterium]|nr:ABC transporter permease [Planctomycetota bacterium]
MSPSTTATVQTWLARLGPALGLIAVWLLFWVLAPQGFVAWENQRLMLLQTAIVGTAAVGATLVIIAGGIDLSVGSAIALGTVVVAGLLRDGCAAWVAGLAGVLAGGTIGLTIGALVVGRVLQVAALVPGLLVAWVRTGSLTLVAVTVFATALAALGLLAPGLRARGRAAVTAASLAAGFGAGWLMAGTAAGAEVALGTGIAAAGALATARIRLRVPLSPFIVTLAMWGALRGIAKGLGDNQPVYVEGKPWLLELMRHGDSGLRAVAAPGVWLMLALAVLAGAGLLCTRFGRHVVAIGSSEQTARLCGVPVEGRKVAIYALASGCAGLAAVLQFAFLGMGDPTTAEGYELRVIAAVVIGGASLTGGVGSIAGTLVGALIMTVVDNGCTRLGLENWVQEIVTGVIILAAVAVDTLRNRGAR